MNDVPNTNSINNVNVQPMSNAQTRTLIDNKPSDDKKMKTSTKLMIGASALAAVVLAGVMIRKGGAAKKAADESKKIVKGLDLAEEVSRQKNRMKPLFNGYASEKELAAKIAEIDKLPLEEQLEAYNQLDMVKDRIIMLKRLNKNENLDEVILDRGMKGVPSDVKDAMNKENWIEAGELYEAHVQKLPETFRPKNVGETITETISNILGKDSKVKPHNYDLSKEGEEIVSLRNYGGYYPVISTKKGVLYDGVQGSTSLSSTVGSNGNWQKATKVQIKDDAHVTHGLNKEGNYVAVLEMTDPYRADTSICLGLISKGKDMTPAQKDLVSLAENPERFDPSLIDVLTKKAQVKNTGAENMDYDLALSIIQSMAKG